MRTTSGTIIETKAAAPAIVVGAVSVLVGALYGVLRAYGFDPSDEQNMALLGLGSALQYVLFVVTAYLAPHTDRPDLRAKDTDPPPLA